MPINWNILGLTYTAAKDNFKAAVGAEVFEQILSIPDTVAFIEFIYEEAAQTLLFAIYVAHKHGQDEIAQEALNYLKHELLPDAIGMISTWGALNPATRTCFQRFFDAVEISADIWDKVLNAPKPGWGTLLIYSDEPDTAIYIEGKFKGYAGPTTPLKLYLEAGRYDLEAKKEGFQVAVRHPTVKANELTIIKIDMVKLPEGEG